MKSNEEYLDELLQSMNSDNADDSARTRFNLSSDNADSSEFGQDEILDSDMDTEMTNQQILDDLEEKAEEPVQETLGQEDMQDSDESSMLAQLMAEMQEESGLGDTTSFDEDGEGEKIPENESDDTAGASSEDVAELGAVSLDDLMPEEDFSFGVSDDSKENSQIDSRAKSLDEIMQDDGTLDDDIEALLKEAQSTAEVTEMEEVDAEKDGDLAEIEALLNMSDSDEIDDDNMKLLQMLEAQDSEKIPLGDEEFEDAESEEEKIEGLKKVLTGEVKLDEEAEETEEDDENKKEGGKIKNFFQKIFSILTEEVSDEEEDLEKGISISDENKAILKELDQEEDKKAKAKEKKSKKEKPKKEKKEKPKKASKEKKVKVSEPAVPEKKLSKKKVIVVFVFAVSILALLLLVEFFAVPMVSLKSAREAYDKGDYGTAYKEYYGQELSEEDENRFQAATVIMRMQSNLDSYQSYKSLKNEVYAIHSLLEAVHNKSDVFMKAEEYGVLPQVEIIYNNILEILNGQYHISETEALELTQEESDAVYTRKLEALAEKMDPSYTAPVMEKQEDVLPEEEMMLDSEQQNN